MLKQRIIGWRRSLVCSPNAAPPAMMMMRRSPQAPLTSVAVAVWPPVAFRLQAVCWLLRQAANRVVAHSRRAAAPRRAAARRRVAVNGGVAASGDVPSAGATASGGVANAGATTSGGASAISPTCEKMVPQEGNPAIGIIDDYKEWKDGDLSKDKSIADNMITWQMDHGGFYKWDDYKTCVGWEESQIGRLRR